MTDPKAGDYLDSMIALAGLNPQSAYTTGEVARILGFSLNTIKTFCDIYEPSSISHTPCALLSYRSRGGDRRIPHAELMHWLNKNDSYERDSHLPE